MSQNRQRRFANNEFAFVIDDSELVKPFPITTATLTFDYLLSVDYIPGMLANRGCNTVAMRPTSNQKSRQGFTDQVHRSQ